MGEPRLIGAVAAQELTVAPEVVLEVGRAGAEEVIARVMGVDPDCSTTAFIRQDDL
jgi:hypothetical protein